MNRIYIFLLLFVPITCISSAKNINELGFLPSLNINKKLPQDWSFNLNAQSRQSLIKEDFNYEYLLTDVLFAAGKKVTINTTIVFGYLMRFEDKEISQRSLQQISFVKRYTTFRLSHRIATDQTFYNYDYNEFRFRYRISSEIPLGGLSLDSKELYLKLNNEYLNSFQRNNYDLEIRGAAFLGYVVTPKNKLEIGFDYRVDLFIENNSRNLFWMALNIFQSI